mmetsp:Transcript_31682/g.36014  ORF Transcript_31682/g.36014 Transcript_31682/m.36014 type:complete len:375 (-) Transcript_31682:353-1477(-)
MKSGIDKAIKMSRNYSTNSKLQRKAVGFVSDRGYFNHNISTYFKENPSEVENTAEPFTIADFGCADGSNSLAFYREIIDTVRAIAPRKHVEINCCDMEGNSWDQLAANLEVLTGEYDDVHIEPVKGSFYSTGLKDSSVNFAICCNAIHWLSEAPTFISDLIYMRGFQHDDISKQDRDAWDERMKKDLEEFYTRRHRELKKGGYLLLSTAGLQEHLNEVDEMAIYLYRGTNSRLSKVLEKHNLLEFKSKFMAPLGHRTMADYIEGTKNPLSPFKVVQKDYADAEMDEAKRLIAAKDFDGHRQFLKGALGAFLLPLYRSALHQCGIRQEGKVEKIADEIMVGITEQYPAASPELSFSNHTYLHLLLQKSTDANASF